jgi:hypothetical protein
VQWLDHPGGSCFGETVHKTTNVLNKSALSVQINRKIELREIYGGPTRAAAEATIDAADKYRARYDKGRVACPTTCRQIDRPNLLKATVCRPRHDRETAFRRALQGDALNGSTPPITMVPCACHA